MKARKVGGTYEFHLEGSVGESSPLFGQDVRGASRIVINGEKMTFMNSIGVKNWIIWTMRISANCQFVLQRVPLVMVSQASTVVGFMPAHGVIESFNAPYVCPKCETEKLVNLANNRDYAYAGGGKPRRLNLPKVPCPKCKTEMEPDFLESKVFTFLDRGGRK